MHIKRCIAFKPCVIVTLLDSPDPPFGRVATARLSYVFGPTYDEAERKKEVNYLLAPGHVMIWNDKGM